MARYKGKPKNLSIHIIDDVLQGAIIHLIRIRTNKGTFRRLYVSSVRLFFSYFVESLQYIERSYHFRRRSSNCCIEFFVTGIVF